MTFYANCVCLFYQIEFVLKKYDMIVTGKIEVGSTKTLVREMEINVRGVPVRKTIRIRGVLVRNLSSNLLG